jgi:Cu-Zn family superoxide dismutase
MKNYRFLPLIATFLVGCASNNAVTTDSADNLKAVASVMAKSNSDVKGTVTFTQDNDKVTMTANISGLTPGNHAIHIHAVGDCSADDGSSAGGHWNPANVNHGMWGTSPFHIGDIGNILADSNGVGSISRETDLWCIGCDDEAKNVIGKAIIIHKGLDDFSSQPSGAAGPRVGCGEIILQEKN